MAHFTRTWWGNRFIDALEQFTDPGRLSRGRSYAHNGRIKEWVIEKGMVKAKVRGSINPYYGVYKEPLYTTELAITQISLPEWHKVIATIGARASFVSKLLLNEMPDTIETAFAASDLHFMPGSRKDFKTGCSCPDDFNPCKHIAGVYYLLAAQLDHDPFLLFELRGLSKAELRAALAKSPLGQILAADLEPQEAPIQSATSYFTRPLKEAAPETISLKEFWTGAKRLPATIEAAAPTMAQAILIKKGGDFPPFWPKDSSFIAIMEDFYQRVRTKSPQMK